jgi:hypothetical protein
MSARQALLRMQADGLIELPPARHTGGGSSRNPPVPFTAASDPQPPVTGFRGDLCGLRLARAAGVPHFCEGINGNDDGHGEACSGCSHSGGEGLFAAEFGAFPSFAKGFCLAERETASQIVVKPDPFERSCGFHDSRHAHGDQSWIDAVITLVSEQWEPLRTSAGPWETFQQDLVAWLQRLGQQIAVLWIQRLVATEAARPGRPQCAMCGRPMRRVGERPLTKLSQWGPITWTRPYWTCPVGHGGSGIGDATLGIGSASVMPEVAEAMAWCGVRDAFDHVAETLTRLWKVAIDGETVRRVVERIGGVAEAQDQAAMAAVTAGAVPDPGPDGPAALVVETDGAMVNFQDADPGWHEVKCGVAYALDALHKLGGSVDACFGLEPRPECWPRLTAHARRMGLDSRTCRQVVLLGDGADWIWRDGPTYLGGPQTTVVEILDIYHARQHLWQFAEACFGDRSAAARAWVEPLSARRETEGPAPI